MKWGGKTWVVTGKMWLNDGSSVVYYDSPDFKSWAEALMFVDHVWASGFPADKPRIRSWH